MSHSNLSQPSVPLEEQPDLDDSSQLQPQLPAESTVDRQPDRFQPKRRWMWFLGLVVLLGGVGGSWRWWQTSRASQAPLEAANKPPAITVKLATVASSTVRESSVFIGTLQAPRFVTIKPQIDGRIDRLYIKEGDRVQQGQPIVSLQSDDTQAVLQQRQAALEQAKANLALLEAGTRSEQIGQARATLAQAQAKLKDSQAGAQPQEIAQAVAQIDAAKSALNLAKSRTLRYEQLAQQGAVSQDQLEGYRQAQRSNEAALVVAQKRLDQLRQGRRSDINSLSAAVEQQQQNLQQQLNGPRPEEIAQARSQVSQAAAQVRSAQVQLQYTKIVAPFTGVVGNIPVKAGDFAAKGDALTTLTKNDSFDLNLSVPLSQASQLRSGLPVELLDGAGKSIEIGKISFIAPNVTAESQTILAKATFPNSSGQLRNNQSVQARIIWAERSGILIPVTAVSRLGGKTFVFVAQPPSSTAGNTSLIAQQTPIELGAIEGNNYQVVQGLKPGDKIVTSGFMNLTNGAPIAIAPEENNAR